MGNSQVTIGFNSHGQMTWTIWGSPLTWETSIFTFYRWLSFWKVMLVTTLWLWPTLCKLEIRLWKSEVKQCNSSFYHRFLTCLSLISIGHLYHSYVSHNQRVSIPLSNLQIYHMTSYMYSTPCNSQTAKPTENPSCKFVHGKVADISSPSATVHIAILHHIAILLGWICLFSKLKFTVPRIFCFTLPPIIFTGWIHLKF